MILSLAEGYLALKRHGCKQCTHLYYEGVAKFSWGGLLVRRRCAVALLK